MGRKRPEREFLEFILMALLGTGPLRYEELWETFIQLASHFSMGSRYFVETFPEKAERFIAKLGLRPRGKLERERRPKKRDREPVESMFKENLSELSRTGMIRLSEEGKYELTEAGRQKAQKFRRDMEKGAELFRNQILSPAATARNTVFVDLFLALIKLIAGFMSGSVALIADGADAGIDTISALIVWAGIQYKREHLGTLVIILMMFLTCLSIGYESLTAIYSALTSTFNPIARPYLVITIELIALICALILAFYQRYVGKMNGSLPLISQSIDSQNHIYVAGAVIIGAIFSIMGIHFIDALIGAYIAVRILKDAVGLSREAISSIKGEETDFSAYRIPFEKHYEGFKTESFRGWIMYSILEDGLRTRRELIASLEKVFKPKYVPIVTEFGFSLGRGFDFKGEFDNLTGPLLDKGYLVQEGDSFELTVEGKKSIEKWIRDMRFYATE